MYSIRCVLIFLAVGGAFLTGYGQDNKQQAAEIVQQADEILAATPAYDDVRDLYVMAANLDPENLRANFQAGYMHVNTIQKDKAAQYFLRVYEIDPTYRFDLEYWIAVSYQHGLEFDKAIDFFNRYKEKVNKRPNYQGKDKKDPALADQGIFECENGKEYVADPQPFSIVNMGSSVNSEWDDYGPVLNENEDEVIFTSRRRDGNLNENVADDNKPFEDIFISKKKDGNWSYAVNIGAPLNTPYHDSNLALSADGNTLLIYTVEGTGDIYFSRLISEGVWSESAPLKGIVNSEDYEENSASMTKDEKLIFFASNRPGGFGGRDLYMAKKNEKGEWREVQNLGKKINTEFDEDGPFIDYDSKTLYFSSKGHKSMGGYDIYKAVYNVKKDEWTEPENVGYPINTPENDIYFVSTKDGKRAYYSSVREDGIGYDDIYMITGIDKKQWKKELKEHEKEKEKEPVVEPVVEPVKEEPKIEEPKVEPVKEEPKKEEPKVEPVKEEPVKEDPKKEIYPLKFVVSVQDASTRQLLSAKVKLQGAKDNIVIGSKSLKKGVFQFTIKTKGVKDYRLTVESDGYVFINQSLALPGLSYAENTINRIVDMTKLEVGVVSVLRNLYFDFNKATFKQESYVELNKLESMMLQNPNLKVEIGGHTDKVGPKEYNLLLSRKRAEAVKDFLTKKGIDSRRVKVVGYGSSKPLASNDDEDEGRELNRRVELKVLGI